MGSEEDRQLLIQVANLAPNPVAREEAAERYKQIFKQDVPVFEGPALEGQPRMGPASRIPATSAAPESPAEPTASGTPWQKRIEHGLNRVNDVVTMGAWPAIEDALGIGSPRGRREALERDPEATGTVEVGGQQIPLTNVVGDTTGGLLGMVAGPVRALGEAAAAGGQGVARLLAPHLQRLPAAAQRVAGVVGRAIVGAGTGVAGNAAMNIAHEGPPIPTDMNEAMRLFETAGEGSKTASALGAGGDLLAALLTRGRGTLHTVGAPPGQKNWVGRFADHKARGAYEPDATARLSEGDVTFSRNRQGSVAGMEDTRRAADVGAERALSARETTAANERAQAEMDIKRYEGIRSPRSKMLQDLAGEEAANVEPGLGVADESLARVHGKIRTKLEGARPAPRPVLEGARVPVEQPGLPLPGRDPLTEAPPPMQVPRESYQGRLPFGPPEPQPPPGGAQDYLYHVTSADRLGGIQERGLSPGQGRLVADDVDTHGANKVFLTERGGVGTWHNTVENSAWSRADRQGKNYAAEGQAPVTLRVKRGALQNPEIDAGGSRDAGSPAWMVEHVDPRALEYWDGKAWRPLSDRAGFDPRIVGNKEGVESPLYPQLDVPGVSPPTELYPPEPRAGQQLEISAPGSKTIPGYAASGGAGSYQPELPLPRAEPRTLSIEEAAGDPTVGGLRRFRTEARKRSALNEPDPSEPAQDARNEYGFYDRAIDRATAGEPGFAEIQGRMAESASKYREAGDLLVNDEASVQRNKPRAVADDLGLELAATSAEAPDVRASKREQAATILQRVGDTTEAGKTKRQRLERLRELDPEYAAALDLVEAKRAQMAVTPSLKNEVPINLPGMAEGGGFWGPMIRQNLRVVGGRLIDPSLSLGIRVAPKLSLAVPFLRNPIDALLAGKREE